MRAPHLSPCTVATGLVFVSGQLGFDSDGATSGDVGDQTRAALAHLEARLKEAGCGLEDVVKTTVWLSSAADFSAFNAAYAEVFGVTKPARSTVVAELVVTGALVEIEAIAVGTA